MIRNLPTILDRTTLVIIALFIITAISAITVSIYTKKEERTNTELNAQLAEMQSAKDKFIKLKQTIDIKERKMGLTKTDGVISTLEQNLNALGIKASTIRQLAKNNIEGYIVEDAELEIRGIDLNAIVNLLYRIENSPFPLRIKGAFIKTTFDNPDRFIMRLTISFISKA